MKKEKKQGTKNPLTMKKLFAEDGREFKGNSAMTVAEWMQENGFFAGARVYKRIFG